jgi:YspA, cpYpsA-related SLOG family
MRILVTGSREWTDNMLVYTMLDGARNDTPHDQIVLVHGGARGVDRIAARYADSMDWGVETHIPSWEKYGKRAGILRNMAMVDAGADVCVAFILNESRGATHCAAYAESKGIPVIRVTK